MHHRQSIRDGDAIAEVMWRWRCGASDLLLYTVHLSLLVGWLVLTGIKIGHFLSEPTALQSRLDSDFRPPFVSIFPGGAFGSISSSTPMDLNEHLILIRDSWIENLRDSETQCAYLNEANTEETRYKWPIFPHTRIFGVTTIPEDLSDFYLCLPMKGAIRKLIGTTIISYYVVLHSDRHVFSYDPDVDAILRIENNVCHRHIEVTIDREEKLNLRRLPCNPDTSYSLGTCQRRCYMDWINCSLGETQNSMKTLCQEDDYNMLKQSLLGFDKHDHLGNGEERYDYGINASFCDCPVPCVRDRISFSIISTADACAMGNKRELFYVRFSMKRMRRTAVTVLAFDLEDLLAYIGGYLGLLLGSSTLSMFETGKRLAGRLARGIADGRVPARHIRQEEKDVEEGTWSPGRFSGTEVALPPVLVSEEELAKPPDL